MLNIGVLVSGGGTNLQKLIDAQAAGQIVNGQLRVVIASRPDAYALERAKKAGIEAITLRRKDYDPRGHLQPGPHRRPAGAAAWTWWCWPGS